MIPEQRVSLKKSCILRKSLFFGCSVFVCLGFCFLCGFVLSCVSKFFPQPIPNHEKKKKSYVPIIDSEAFEQLQRLCQSKKRGLLYQDQLPFIQSSVFMHLFSIILYYQKSN